jgi:hypothetical protein
LANNRAPGSEVHDPVGFARKLAWDRAEGLTRMIAAPESGGTGLRSSFNRYRYFGLSHHVTSLNGQINRCPEHLTRQRQFGRAVSRQSGGHAVVRVTP